MPYTSKFYMASDGEPAVAPDYWTVWNDTSECVRRPCMLAKSGTAIETVQIERTGTFSPPLYVLLRQFVSAPVLGEVNFGSLLYFVRKLVTRARASYDPPSGTNQPLAYLQVKWRVVSPNGQHRGSLNVNQHPPTNPGALLGTELQNRRYEASLTWDSFTSSDGDLMVAEVGISIGRKAGWQGAASVMAEVEFGDPPLSDLADNYDDSAPGCPWFKFYMPVNLIAEWPDDLAIYHRPRRPQNKAVTIGFPKREPAGVTNNAASYNEE